jgi:hypothetical protein
LKNKGIKWPFGQRYAKGFDCMSGREDDRTGFDEASGQLPGPVGVHAWPFDEDKVGRTEEKDADPKGHVLKIV